MYLPLIAVIISISAFAGAQTPTWLRQAENAAQTRHLGTFLDGTILINGAFSTEWSLTTINGIETLHPFDNGGQYLMAVSPEGQVLWAKVFPPHSQFIGFSMPSLSARVEGDRFFLWGRIEDGGMTLDPEVHLAPTEPDISYFGAVYSQNGALLEHFTIANFQIHGIASTSVNEWVMLVKESRTVHFNIVWMSTDFSVIREEFIAPLSEGLSTVSPNRLLTDEAGNIYISAYFRGEIDLDLTDAEHIVTAPNMLGSNNYFYFTVKYTRSGAIIWGLACEYCEDLVLAVDEAGIGYGQIRNPNQGYIFPELGFSYSRFIFTEVSPTGTLQSTEVPPIQDLVGITSQGIRYTTVKLVGNQNFDYDPGSDTAIPSQFRVQQLLVVRYDKNLAPTFIRPFNWDVDSRRNPIWAAKGQVNIAGVVENTNGSLRMIGDFSGSVDFDSGPGTRLLVSATAPDGYNLPQSFDVSYASGFAAADEDRPNPECGVLAGMVTDNGSGPGLGGLASCIIAIFLCCTMSTKYAKKANLAVG